VPFFVPIFIPVPAQIPENGGIEFQKKWKIKRICERADVPHKYHQERKDEL